MLIPIIYFIAAFIEIFGEFLENYNVIFYSKIILMPLLMLYVYLQTKAKGKYLFLILGLFFSWFGDIFLMIRHQQAPEKVKLFFILGLASFLIAHVQYIIAFIKEIYLKNKVSIVVSKPYIVLPFLLFIITLWIILGNSINEVKIPIYLYSIVICTMSITAFNRKELVNKKSFLMVFVGALLFMFSDSCIAISVFKQHFYLDRVIIMATYIVAQYLIVTGFLLNNQEN